MTLSVLWGMLALTSTAQELSNCLKMINSKATLSTVNFTRVLQLDNNRLVNEFLGKELVPMCIQNAIANPDSLQRAGVQRVLQVRIKDKTMYYFEHDRQKKYPNCRDCATQTIYYDNNCTIGASLSVGGIAGTRASAGYTVTDFASIKIMKILWITPH
jgi:hypothetical protein